MSNLLLKTRDFTKKKTNGQAENYPEGLGKSQRDRGEQNSELPQCCDDSVSAGLIIFYPGHAGRERILSSSHTRDNPLSLWGLLQPSIPSITQGSDNVWKVYRTFVRWSLVRRNGPLGAGLEVS